MIFAHQWQLALGKEIAVLEEEATLTNGERNPGNLIDANAQAECAVAAHDAGVAPR